MQPATPPRPWRSRLQDSVRKSVATIFVVATTLSAITITPTVARLALATRHWLERIFYFCSTLHDNQYELFERHHPFGL